MDSHEKPWDTDFMVQPRNETYKNCAKIIQKFTVRSGGGGHIIAPPLPEYTTDNNNNLAKKLKDDRHKDGVAYAVQTTMCVSWTPINGRLLSAGFKHTAECSHLRLQKG